LALKQVLVIGGGGREHALCWKLAQSPQVAKIYCAPGNAGTAQELKTQNVALSVMDFQGLLEFARKNKIDLTIVGPDNPLAEGIVDFFERAGQQIFGPNQEAARLESSKVFAKRFMKANHIPTAKFEVFDSEKKAVAFCHANDWARVIKVDGLALGKGVYVCDSLKDCELALAEIFQAQRFGISGAEVVIEERLFGPEISLMILSDGKTLLPFTSSQDYKRRFEGNKGPNTGGMGAFSPVPFYPDYERVIQEKILEPLEEALQQADFTFKGVLFAGILIHQQKPYVLEFNARFGDPETQCLLPRLQNDLYELLQACVDSTLNEQELIWDEETRTCLVLVHKHYPESGSKGKYITVGKLADDVLLFHAGTARDQDGELVTQGGRVLNIVSKGISPDQAILRAYKSISAIGFEGMAFRKDIAKDVSLCLSN